MCKEKVTQEYSPKKLVKHGDESHGRIRKTSPKKNKSKLRTDLGFASMLGKSSNKNLPNGTRLSMEVSN